MIERLSHRYIARTHTLTLYLTQLLHTFDIRLTYTICLLFFLFLVFFSFFLFSSLLLFLFTFPMLLFPCVWRNYASRKFRLSYSSLLIFLSIAFFVYSLDVHASRFQLLRKKAFLFFCKVPFQLHLTKSYSPTVRPCQIVSSLIQYDRKQLQFIQIIHSKMNLCLISYSNYLNSY